MLRWTLIILAGLMIYAPLEPTTALAQGNSVLVPNEPADFDQSNGKDPLLESVFWGTDRLSTPETKQYGYEMDSASYGYPPEEYGFRPEDEYSAQEDGQYGYKLNDDDLIDLQMYQ